MSAPMLVAGSLAGALLAAVPAVAQPAGPSCADSLQRLRDRLAELVPQIEERSQACASREPLLRRIDQLAAERDGERERADRLGKENRRLREEYEAMRDTGRLAVERLLAVVMRMLPSDSCDAVQPPRFVEGRVELSGEIGNREAWRQRAEKVERELGVPVTLDRLSLQPCGVVLSGGWRLEIQDGRARRMPRPLTDDPLRQRVPRADAGICAELGRDLEAKAKTNPEAQVLNFWVASPPGAPEPPGAWQLCSRRGTERWTLDENYRPGQPYPLITRDAP